MASNVKSLAIAAAAIAGLGALLVIYLIIRVVFHTPGTGANIGAGLAGMLGVLLLLVAAGLALGSYINHRRTRKQGAE